MIASEERKDFDSGAGRPRPKNLTAFEVNDRQGTFIVVGDQHRAAMGMKAHIHRALPRWIGFETAPFSGVRHSEMSPCGA
jgi:hypothetical protein